MTRRNDLLQQKNQHQRRLQLLELQRARQGFNTPPDTIMEIEDIRAAMEQIEQELAWLDAQEDKERTEEVSDAAINRYLEWVCAVTGKVTLRGIKRGGQQAIELPLDQVYVPLAAEALPEAREELKRSWQRQTRAPGDAEKPETTRTIAMTELLAQGRRLAVIGAPGCGKTTVLQHIAWTLAEARRSGQPQLAAERLGLRDELPVPIYVPLSLYAEHRRRFADHPDPRMRQLASFIGFYLLDRQASLDLPPDFFARLLDQGRDVILLLDGLDEVPSDAERALVAQAVEDLTRGRKDLRFVVTSRTPAYQGKAQLGAGFRVIRVLPISPEQVADLIGAAYQAIYPTKAEQRERERRTADLVEGVAKLEAERRQRMGEGEESRLITTPLLVRMLLIVHFNLRRLPDQRAELYMEMVDTLLTSSHNPDEAVAQRLAQLGGDWRGRRDMAQYLAFSMHNAGEKAGRQIAEREMGTLLTDYLSERRRKPREVAEELAADFIANSRERGGLLEEQGGRFRFSHLSFQEFLTARYLAEGLRQVDRIVDFLQDEGRALQSWWREPALLTLGYLSIAAPEAAADLIYHLGSLNAAQRPSSAVALASAELAGTGFLEWGGADITRNALADRLAELLQDPALTGVPAGIRAVAGRTLARLGDLRPGVGVRDGIPDIVWCPVPADEFKMGNTQATDPQAFADEMDQHPVTLPAFAISKYPITNAQFDAFVQDEGYGQKWRQCWTDAGWRWKGDRMGPEKYGGVYDLPNHPAVNVSWYEAVAFCRWLSAKLGQPVTLPSEAQWERAARHTDGRRYPWGEKITPEHANFDQTGIGTTTAVGIFPKGAAKCGALDMSGNVWEWTRSLWGEDWQKPSFTYPYDPQDAAREDLDAPRDIMRVVRGGSFDHDARLVRCAVRSWSSPDIVDRPYGLRVVVCVPQSS